MHERNIDYRAYGSYARDHFVIYDEGMNDLMARATEMFESLVQLRKEQKNNPMHITKDIKSHSL